MRVMRLEVGLLASNAYLISDGQDSAAAVIDPGGDGETIVRLCRDEGLNPELIVNTHCHADHVGANGVLKAAFPDAALCIGRADAGGLADPTTNLSAMLGSRLDGPAADRLLDEEDELRVGALTLCVLETPGHTPGGICLLAADESPPQLFCGDLIFRGGVGRVDFPGGSGRVLLDSIRSKVLTLPDDTVLWPGHGESSTVGRERRENPFLGSDALVGF